MKIIRYLNSNNGEEIGILHADGSRERAEGNVYEGLRGTGQSADVQKLLAPIQPTSIVGIGLNYRRHAEETNAKIPQYPVVFFKGMNSLQNPGDPIEIPTVLASDEVDFECELVVVIGKKGKNIPKEKALDYVLGYTCGNDVSARIGRSKRAARSGAGASPSTPFARSGRCWSPLKKFRGQTS